MPRLIDDRYELVDVITSGGMATVWRAHDVRLDRSVALKRPHPAPDGDDSHRRFDREARAAAALSHPHLVTVYDVGHDESGPYLVMELIEGPTLAEFSESLDHREALELVADVADALATIHAAGIVHRDVKPANILISERGPKLTDFGVALDDDTGRLTTPGTVFATPRYAPPEQLAGETVTPAGDVFSLGAVLYELITGEAPFGGDRSLPPSPVGDEALDRLLARVLAPEPRHRPTAAEFATSLRRLLPTVPVLTRAGDTRQLTTPIPAVQARVEPRSNRPLMAVAAAGMALLAVIAVAALSWGQREPPVTTAPPTTTPSPTTAPPTTVPTTASPPTTVAPTTVAATAPPPRRGDAKKEADRAAREAHRDFKDALAEIGPPALVPPDQREMVAMADAALKAVRDGRYQEARDLLDEIAADLDENLEDEDAEAAREALEDLYRVLGLR